MFHLRTTSRVDSRRYAVSSVVAASTSNLGGRVANCRRSLAVVSVAIYAHQSALSGHKVGTVPVTTILVIDDEPQIRRVVRHTLERVAERLLEAATGAEGIDLAAAHRPDLVILDLGLPDMEGIAVCSELRRWSPTPIIVLSARHSESEKTQLLDAGADDYMTKPFSPPELAARVRAQLRRARMVTPSGVPGPIVAGDLTIDTVARVVTRAGERVHLTKVEFELLRVLVAHAGRTLTHQQLFNEVWSGRSHGDAQQYLRVHVAHLRRKLEVDTVRPRHLHTEPGVGYRFDLD